MGEDTRYFRMIRKILDISEIICWSDIWAVIFPEAATEDVL